MSDLIDSSAVIDAAASHYRMSICPGFWDWLAAASGEGSVVLMPAVRAELTAKDEKIERWLRDSATVSTPAIQLPIDEAYRTVRETIDGLDCTQSSVEKFVGGADFHLVAYALAGSHRVVTNEVREDPKKKSHRRLKIPDLCDRLEIACIRPVQMLEEHGARFIWAGGATAL